MFSLEQEMTFAAMTFKNNKIPESDFTEVAEKCAEDRK